MDIKHARRILAVAPPDVPVLDVIKELTGTAPTPDAIGSIAGLTHEWDVKTAYYSAKVPMWIDEISDVHAWKQEFLKPEAQEVVQAVGAWVFCFHTDGNGLVGAKIEETLKAVQEVVEQHAGFGADTVMLAVAMPHRSVSGKVKPKHEDCDDTCRQYGFEFVDFSAEGTNEFGEKLGVERLKEALEANEWAAAADENDLQLEDLDFDTEDNEIGRFEREEAEMTAELFGMKTALTGDDDDDYDLGTDDFLPAHQQAAEVDDLDKMMGRLLAVKEQIAGLPEAQRKRMAAQAVREMMRSEPAG